MLLGEQVKTIKALAPQAIGNASVNGVTIDARQDVASAILVIETGASSGSPTSVSVTAKVQDSADGSTFSDVAGATMAAIGANAHGEINVDLRGLKKYARVVVAVSHEGGTSPTTLVSGTWILGDATKYPI